VDGLARDRHQLWAEAKVMFDSGCAWWLDTAELAQMASNEQIERYEGDPWEDVIGRWADDRPSVSISEILERCLQKPQGLWTQSDKNRAARKPQVPPHAPENDIARIVTPFEGIRRGDGHVSPYQILVPIFATIPTCSIWHILWVGRLTTK
jgi:predicted P-loop ATPase